MSSKRYKFACVPIEDSDQHAHLRKLIRVFDGRAMGSQWTNDSSDRKPMHLSDWADKQTNFNLCCRHMSTDVGYFLLQMDCEPVCDEGYSWPNKFHRYPLTCEDGHWYTSEYAYNGDNICFPNGKLH